jgi:anti-anti-sigma regulatory factor
LSETYATLTFTRGLDISRYPEIVETFRNCPEEGSCVIIDLSNATWIDSVFMTELLVFYRKTLKQNRTMVIVANGNVEKMLAIAGVNRRIRVVADPAEARKSPARAAWEKLHPQTRLSPDGDGAEG